METDTIKQVEMKNLNKEYLWRARKLLETKLWCRNLIKGLNTCVVPLLNYSVPFLKYTREELKKMNKGTWKLMTMHKALHPRDDVERLQVTRKGVRGLASNVDSFDPSIQRPEDYIEKPRKIPMTATRNNTNNMRTNRTAITRKQKWEEKQLYGRFKQHLTRENVDESKKGKP